MDEPGRGSLDCCRRRDPARRTHQGTHHRHLRSPARVSPVKPLDTLANDPVTRAPPQKLRRPFRVMRRRESLTRRSATRPFGLRGLAGRLVLPSIVRRRSWGSSLRRFAPATGGRASLHIRAHMPFHSRRPTRLIFVGLIRLARGVSVRQWAMTDRGRLDVGFWASLPFAVRVATHCPGARAPIAFTSRSILPWALPLSGVRARVCAPAWARPRANHQPPDASLDTSHPLMRFGDPSRLTCVLARCRRISPSFRRDAQSHHCIAGTSAFWRG